MFSTGKGSILKTCTTPETPTIVLKNLSLQYILILHTTCFCLVICESFTIACIFIQMTWVVTMWLLHNGNPKDVVYWNQITIAKTQRGTLEQNLKTIQENLCNCIRCKIGRFYTSKGHRTEFWWNADKLRETQEKMEKWNVAQNVRLLRWWKGPVIYTAEKQSVTSSPIALLT